VLVSIVITVKNEARSIGKLLDSLLAQEKTFEIIIVDAHSIDTTRQIVEEYAEQNPEIRLFVHEGTRGYGRNFGVEKAQGEVIAFIDGGCKADSKWLKELRRSIVEGYDIVAGKTINVGPFADITRVEVNHKGYDVTFPACNLAYKKEIFQKIGGFDTGFVTAEDVDLNFRAVDAGAQLAYNEHAVVYRDTSRSVVGFLKQAFWYGYGRKQLTMKHGKLWSRYSPQKTLQTHFSLFGILRLVFGSLGYISCSLRSRAI